MSKQKPIRVSVFVPAKVDAKVEKIARATKESKSSVYCAAIEHYLESLKENAA